MRLGLGARKTFREVKFVLFKDKSNNVIIMFSIVSITHGKRVDGTENLKEKMSINI